MKLSRPPIRPVSTLSRLLVIAVVVPGSQLLKSNGCCLEAACRVGVAISVTVTYFVPDDSRPIGDNPRGYYTVEYQKLTRAKIARIHCPILIIQGDQDPRVFPFNNQVFIPELRALGKKVEVITYPGEPHCFNFNGNGPRTPHPAAALKAFHDIDVFCRRYIKTSPRTVEAGLVKYVAVDSTSRRVQ